MASISSNSFMNNQVETPLSVQIRSHFTTNECLPNTILYKGEDNDIKIFPFQLIFDIKQLVEKKITFKAVHMHLHIDKFYYVKESDKNGLEFIINFNDFVLKENILTVSENTVNINKNKLLKDLCSCHFPKIYPGKLIENINKFTCKLFVNLKEDEISYNFEANVIFIKKRTFQSGGPLRSFLKDKLLLNYLNGMASTDKTNKDLTTTSPQVYSHSPLSQSSVDIQLQSPSFGYENPFCQRNLPLELTHANPYQSPFINQPSISTEPFQTNTRLDDFLSNKNREILLNPQDGFLSLEARYQDIPLEATQDSRAYQPLDQEALYEAMHIEAVLPPQHKIASDQPLPMRRRKPLQNLQPQISPSQKRPRDAETVIPSKKQKISEF